MASPKIVFDGVWKKFRRGERHDSLRDLIPAALARVWRRRPKVEIGHGEFWALKDVTFAVAPGEALGIIGANGAGKSTTLKLLTKILRPTKGSCAVSGRVGALIEVAAGFHPDLTGRENIYLQAAIMGMRRLEVNRSIDEIVDFAGVGDFIDTPVKRYSSGMNARLGFSIAAHLRPDALIIDEVLSVGDMAFQQKCFARMRRFREEGVAIVFVSHNLQAIGQLCTAALLLKKGEVAAHGAPAAVLEQYVKSGVLQDTAAAREVEIQGAVLLGENGTSITNTAANAPLTLRVTYVARERIQDATFGFVVTRSTDLLVVYDANVHQQELGLDELAAGQSITVDFAFRAHLTRGQYHFESFVFHNPTQEVLARVSPLALLTIEEYRTYAGVADLQLEASIISEDAACARNAGL